MKVSDGRGITGTEIGRMNREDVRDFFKKNPGATITACCKAVKLSYMPVRKHIDAILKEDES